jgi:glyoxylase-like metal-dependent hydrolase (beta-lactamase superfamily II)
MKLVVERIITSPFGTNAYVLVCEEGLQSLLIDAPGAMKKILNFMEQSKPRYILMTHSHFDHTGALKKLKKALAVPVAAHEADAKSLPLKPDILLKDGDELQFGTQKLKVLHTPGHTPGSLCFLVNHYLFSGDTLFPGGPGRTSSAQAFEQIVASIREKLFVLPDETRVYPGHGDPTVLSREKEAFTDFSRRQHSKGLFGNVLWSKD